MAAWVWNWNYLVLVNRSTQQRADILALAAAPALLDEDILCDFPNTPVADQTDDFVEAVDVTHGKDVRLAGAHLRVHEDAMLLDLYAAGFQVESVDVRSSTQSLENDLGGDGVVLPLVGETDTALTVLLPEAV